MKHASSGAGSRSGNVTYYPGVRYSISVFFVMPLADIAWALEN